ncbi:HD family phosphohydrolase [Aquisalibacillus elongatus]|uniref:HD family phosphohydrolase n=1 Tax=Aquisalibacillus elongatus TaxID=485577 RepID=UPI001475B051|nr:HDIG domain-containing metalloprotein [Aquisalibacillus elongatus]
MAKRKIPMVMMNIKKFNIHSVLASFLTPAIFLTFMLVQYIQEHVSLNQFLISLSMVLLTLFILSMEITKDQNWSRQKTVTFTFIGSGLLILMYAFQAIGTEMNYIYYITPIAAYSILIKYFNEERFAIISSVLMAIFGSFIFSLNGANGYYVFLFLLLSQWFAIFFFESIKDRKSLLKTSMSLLSVHILLVVMFEMTSWMSITSTDFLMSLLFVSLSVLFAVILTLGILPLFEAGFNMLTDTKLLALSNPNHPLLRKVLVEAPGTYHHSVMVANLSESACEAIGANGLLARVASYYHDVGKAIKPHMFIENQNKGKNPHDSLPPEESARIILEHPKDSARLLKEHGLPKEVIDIAEQHHGTTLLKYFYYKAKDRKSNVMERYFRYDGPIPQSKEAAIINICDSVEAAVRSKDKPTNDEINELVRAIIYDRLMDGQFNDSQLTIHEILKVEKDICDMLNGIFHARIEYPKDSMLQPTQGGH